jgi:hypothetical protein
MDRLAGMVVTVEVGGVARAVGAAAHDARYEEQAEESLSEHGGRLHICSHHP